MKSRKSGNGLGDREEKILGFIVRDYIRHGIPISSSLVRKKLRLAESGATIRNIMFDIDEAGFLSQPHTSAGRIPTDKAYRYFVDNLMNDKIPVDHEVASIGRLRNREDSDEFLRKISKIFRIFAASEHAETGRVVGFGMSNLLSLEEFHEDRILGEIGRIFDNLPDVVKVYRENSEDELRVFIGSENPVKSADFCSVYSVNCDLPEVKGNIMLMGSKRIDYERISAFISNIIKM